MPSSPSTESSHSAPKRPLAKRLRRWGLELGAVTVALVLLSAYQNRGLLKTGNPAPVFAAQDLEGQPFDSASLLGKRTILHFWATWCSVCQREFSMLKALDASLPEDAQLITLVADESAPQLRQFAKQHGLTYRVLRAPPELLKRFHVQAFPTNYYVDATGKITDRTVGMSTRWAMLARLP